MMEHAVSIQDMGYNWPDGTPALTEMSMTLPKGCRSVVVGANGAGKTCLLRCIGGVYKYSGKCEVLGKEAYVPTRLGTSGAIEIVAGTNCWRHGNCTIVGERWQPRGDSKVSTMLEFVDGWVPERRDILVERFGIDLDWTVNALSDGRKRRVQLLLAFARPSEVLLLDEVTTDLDVLARETLLQWLREESEQRGVTVLFSTHIFDGLEEWGTHMTYVQDGKIGCNAELGAVSEVKELRAKGCLTPLYTFVEAMVTRDSQMQRAAGRKSTRCSMPVGMVVN